MSNFNSGWGGNETPKQPNNRKKQNIEIDFNNFELDNRKILFGFGILAVIWLATGLYRVNPGQEGVELVFGKLNDVTQPGLQYNYPYPIGRTIVPYVQKVRRVDIGYRPREQRFGGNEIDVNNIVDVPPESLILTSDQNIVDTDFTVFWRIKDTIKYLFNIRDPEQTVKIAAESAMREVVGQTSFDNAVTIGREDIETRTKILLQEILDSYGAGIDIEQVELQKSDPPLEVIDAFNDVQRARQDRDRLRNEAEAYANTVVPEARGKAETVVRDAEGFKEKAIQESKGEAERFLKVYKEYRKSPSVIKKRIYLDTLAEIYGETNKVILDKNASGVLPYIKLPDANRKKGQ
ncbi:MAG: FtsH protease activity modulator HflK [Alphaproteobacteria bacterium]|nr:FtsH protease activity modulator HflK [Alphaproteobacteria bacterium]